MLHLSTEIRHLLAVQLLGDFLEQVYLFEDLVQFVGLFLLHLVLTLVHYLYNFSHFVEFADVKVLGALSDLLGLGL